MRTDKSPEDFLLAVAKKKPRLQAYIDNLANMSDTDIENIQEQLWVKKALNKLKYHGSQSSRLADLLARTIEAEKLAAQAPKETYEVRLWDCESTFIGHSSLYNDNKFQFQIERGDCFMIVESGETLRIGNTVVKTDHFEMTPLLHRSSFVGYMTLDNYRGFCRELLNKKHKL